MLLEVTICVISLFELVLELVDPLPQLFVDLMIIVKMLLHLLFLLFSELKFLLDQLHVVRSAFLLLQHAVRSDLAG